MRKMKVNNRTIVAKGTKIVLGGKKIVGKELIHDAIDGEDESLA